jgi:hypothetical protein
MKDNAQTLSSGELRKEEEERPTLACLRRAGTNRTEQGISSGVATNM